jgi:hypothetical protein
MTIYMTVTIHIASEKRYGSNQMWLSRDCEAVKESKNWREVK